MAAEDNTQANLDALAAAITPTGTTGNTAVPKAVKAVVGAPVHIPASATDHFEAEKKQFELDQLRRKAEFEAKKQEMELEELALSIRAKKAQLRQFEKDEFKLQMAEENQAMDSKTKGLALKQQADAELKNQKRCNHKKGGNGLQGIIGGRGDAGQYAVLKHTMSNGDMWVRCLRCGKTWKPPLERSFKTVAEFVKAQTEYSIAIDFQTLNSPSSSSQFSFSDQGQFYREQMEHATLR